MRRLQHQEDSSSLEGTIKDVTQQQVRSIHTLLHLWLPTFVTFVPLENLPSWVAVQVQMDSVLDEDNAHDRDKTTTGNTLADAIIRRFYAARAALLGNATNIEDQTF